MLQIYLALLDSQAEKDKFITIYEGYRDLMFYVAGRFLSSDADREIAVDAALQALLGVIASIDDPQSTKTKNLVCLVTKRKCIDLLRQKGGMTESDLGDWEETIALESARNASQTGGPAVGMTLQDAILSMSETGREFLVLRYFHGYSTAEIAKILGIGKDAARKRLERAKAELKGILEEDR